LIAAREGRGAANLVRDGRNAKVADQVRGGMWTARAALPAFSLEISRDAGDRKKILSQLVNGEAIVPAPLSVDGKPTRF